MGSAASKDEETRGASGEREDFDAILRRLQGVVEQLEGADLSLEESLRAFEHGVELSRRAQTILDAAERRVEILQRDGKLAPMKSGESD